MLAKASTEIAPSSELSYLKMPSIHASQVQLLRKDIPQENQPNKSPEHEERNSPDSSANVSRPVLDSPDGSEASTDSPACDESGPITVPPASEHHSEQESSVGELESTHEDHDPGQMQANEEVTVEVEREEETTEILENQSQIPETGRYVQDI